MIDVWINNRFGWIIELTKSQYIHTSIYKPLAGSSYMDLPVELRSPRNQHQKQRSKMFLWCHIRHINPLKKHPERIFKNDKKND